MYGGVFWFIPCMLISIIIFNFFNKKFSRKIVILIIISMYILAHLEAIYFLPYNIDYLNWNIIYKFPLNLDVCLMSIAYFSIGFYSKNIIEKIMNNNINLVLYFSVTSICLIFILMNIKGILSYTLNMKIGHYYNFILDIVIPCVFGVWILITSMVISKINNKLTFIFNFIGMNTLPIMYFHIPINGLFSNKIGYGAIGYVSVGIIPALIFIFICSRNRYLEFFFKGKLLNKKSNNEKEAITISN